MKALIAFSVLLIGSVLSCSYPDFSEASAVKFQDTVQPIVTVNGNTVDTAYLYTPYHDGGGRLFDDKDGILNCNDHTLITKSEGEVNTNVPGTYYLKYSATDSLGNTIGSATRTVHVVENSINFINGSYNVSCTCTAVSPSVKTIETVESYTTLVIPENENNRFNIGSLEIGREKIVASALKTGTVLNAHCFSADYHVIEFSGTLDAAKNTFTIESTVYPYSPRVTYKCRNVFTKALVQTFN